LMTGRILGAREALEFGLVSRVVPDAELVPTARALAAEIARETAPVSVAITKWLLWGMQSETDLARADDLDARAFWWTGTQPAARDDDEHARPLQVDDAVADADGLLSHGGGRVPGSRADCKATLRRPPRPIRITAMLVAARRFSALATLVARVYGGYKWIQLTGDGAERYARHHRRSAEDAYALATRLEGLPIKVCQFLGSRADILPAEYVEVLSRLQDRVPPRPLATFLPLLRRELGRPVEAAFAELDPAPLASASLAQVHRGRLPDGREVAVKMQYPDIERVVRVDLRSFSVLIGVLARLERDFD